jgi:hypothetical protein
MSIEYRPLLKCAEAVGTQDEKDLRFIRLLTANVFDIRQSITDKEYLKVCTRLRQAYMEKGYRRKFVRKMLANIRKWDAQSRRSAKTCPVHDG